MGVYCSCGVNPTLPSAVVKCVFGSRGEFDLLPSASPATTTLLLFAIICFIFKYKKVMSLSAADLVLWCSRSAILI